MNNDIALVLLKGRGIPLGKNVMPICLPSERIEYPAGLNCTISGFGSIETGKSSKRLVKHIVNLLIYISLYFFMDDQLFKKESWINFYKFENFPPSVICCSFYSSFQRSKIRLDTVIRSVRVSCRTCLWRACNQWWNGLRRISWWRYWHVWRRFWRSIGVLAQW